MIIKNSSQNPDGTLNFDLQMEQSEADFLISYAVNNLVNRGLINMSDNGEDVEYDPFPEPEGGMQ